MYETNKRDYTLGEWLDIWLEEIAPTKRKPNTISIYRDARRRLLTHHPEAAGILLVELNALQVEGWLDSMRQKYAKSTLRHIRVMLNQAYKSAIKGHNCDDNPVKDAALPAAREKKLKRLHSENRPHLKDVFTY